MGTASSFVVAPVKRAEFISVFLFVFFGNFHCSYTLPNKPLRLKLRSHPQRKTSAMPDQKNSSEIGGKPESQSAMQPQAKLSGDQNIPSNPTSQITNNQKSEAQKLEEDIRSGERWLIGIGIGSVIINTIIALIYWGQLKEMKKATDAATRSANAAIDAVQIAKETLGSSQRSFEVDQRPYLISSVPEFLSPPSPDRQIEANATLKNIGKTPAIKMFWNIKLIPYRVPSHNEERNKFRSFLDGAFAELERKNSIGRKELDESPMPVGHDVAPGFTTFGTTHNPVIVGTRDFHLIEAGELPLFYIGLVSYTDAFNGSYKTEFCYFYTGANPTVWHICDAYNRIR